MTDYSVSINGREYQVKITDQVTLINQEQLQNQLIPINENGLHLFKQGVKAFEIHLQPQNKEEYVVSIGGNRLVAQVSTGYRSLFKKNDMVESQRNLKASMPGLIVSILVKAGDHVTEGQPLIIMESMKMQMHLKSAVNGIVLQVIVKSGDQVEKDQLLVMFH